MDNITQRIANFIVTNVRSLEAGLLAKMSFEDNGGVIGSALDADWHLKDRDQLIKPFHCEIVLVDDSFCVKDLCGETYVNSSSMPLGVNKLARLNDEDEIKIGEYEIRIFLNRESELKETSHSLEQLFLNKSNSLIDGNDNESFDYDIGLENFTENVKELDPIVMLDNKKSSVGEEDLIDEVPLFEVAEDFINNSLKDSGKISSKFTVQADTDNDVTAAFGLNDIRRGGSLIEKESKTTKLKKFFSKSIFSSEKEEEKKNDKQIMEIQPMDDNILDLLEQEVAKTYTKEDTVKSSSQYKATYDNNSFENNHVLGGPLMSGLEVSIGSNSSVEEMQALSVEIGSSLRACVQGLLDLHSQVKDSRYGMMHRSLQPIEDNPLKLGLSYEETIRTMFDENKSAVHLSATSSVEESLKMIKIHNEAVQYATNIALDQILQALSPDTLLKRFSRYNRDQNNSQDEKSWAWGMYENYYKELTSNRQQGFEKLFWEIFEQSYDKKLREKHAE
ncbi:type VI secretion system-associated FHA domain protein TagH [Marinomonas sp. UCMA 3892]|uniref:type VI secretion system-associated FHA domain protein TagH n=1 Tax=Marinomonas sp. UCMA 3892 TaxID=1972585 RepID=UPI00146ECF78|nr:type VI secretion system-associated FHA domain protein TagH [Marinomonas sp. UCMA 3892]NLU99562.1 type VI secretion system-associated FHA domain protein TagH [Marinomonas sp. UCMA 3892]